MNLYVFLEYGLEKKITVELIQREIDRITSVIRYKKMTDKQAYYIISRILLPRIEYRMMNSYLNSSTCKRLTAKYSQTFKNSVQVTCTVPSSAIRHPRIYNLKSISELQNESQINGLIHRLNDAGSVGTSTFICLKDIQLLNWEPTNILISDKIKLNANNNLFGQILNIAHSLGINFQGPRIQELFQWKGANFPIKVVLNNDKLYKSSVKSLRRHHLLFLDQIIDTHNNIILKWPMIGVFTNVSRGKQPNWYKLIDNMIVDPTNPPKLSSSWSSNTYIDSHYPWTQPLNKKRSVRDWSEQFSLLPCLGCNKSEFNTNNNTSCSFSISSDLVPVAITGLMKLKGAQWKFKLPCNFSSIKNHIYNQYNTPTINLLPTIVIPQVPEITLINKFIVSQHYNTLLSIALCNNLSAQYLEFYSDGSLTKQGIQQMCMGSAWIQTSGSQLLSSFSCEMSSWSSSSHAEVIAIFTALLTAPSQCKVKINTDSQTCIDTFKHITTRSLTIRQWLKINNYLVWLRIIHVPKIDFGFLRILETINTKSLLVLLFKVKAHSGVTFNEQANHLAKDALNLEPIQFNIIDTGPLSAIPTWNKFSVNEGYRTNNLRKYYVYYDKVKSQNHIKKLLTDDPLDQSNSDWKLAWKCLSIRNYYTYIKQSNKCTFLFKLIHNELLTLDRLAIRQPKVYSSFTICPLCHLTEENIEHLFLCPQTENQHLQLWNKVISYTTSLLQKSLENNHKYPVIKNDLYTTITSIANNITSDTPSLIKFTSGFIQPNYITTIKQVIGSFNKSRNILNTWSNYFRKSFFKNIWRLRCKVLIEAEKQHGITNRVKRKRAHIIQIENNETNDDSNSNYDNSNNNHDNNNSNNNIISNSVNNSFNIIRGWVSKGIKFLGFRW
ncbi:hypothetical protein Glove_272g24 [Diversispora epigaea]|uniref:RNase H type-1 domain-containing protein n=1 Tax=Diversispora epigaea TaxID=1348612 RepID=A0A397I3X5_9GLOM|nr:hypothetical protein Glove_272g24 [Diversispora epigaea]